MTAPHAAATAEVAAGVGLPKTPTGIRGLDQITRGGLPRGRTTLVTGGTGTGKTLLALQFLVAGAREYAEPGVLLTFEESAKKVSANVASLGFDIEGLQREQLLIADAFRVDPAEFGEAGEFDLEPLFILLAHSIDRIGAKRVVLDTIEVLFGAFAEQSIVRAELRRLFNWLEERSVTAIVTGECHDGLTRHGIEEYVSDCVIVLDQRVREEVATRILRVVKYRGSAHETNEYPFLISDRGFTVVPSTSVRLDYSVSEERVSTGVPRLDHMLGGGPFRGSTLLVSGGAGTGKTTLGAHLVDAACARGERALLVLFEESPDQYVRNMRSVGLDLSRWVDSGLLRVWAARPSAYGLEAHLAIFAELLEDVGPSVAVLDGLAGLLHGASTSEVTSMVAREIYLLKSSGVTTLATTLAGGEETSTVSVSSLVDTWLQLRNVESNGERNRLLSVLKSRGSSHSNQVREFVLTDHGVDLVDVYVGAAGILTGSARIVREAEQRVAAQQRAEESARQRRQLQRCIAENEAQLRLLEEELTAGRAELERLEVHEKNEVADADADRSVLATWRWADPAKTVE
ncbi:circadian clock protein KaiC [Mycobacterium sp. SMC-4]|uniref:circadian clock protein KaiC n=1 Tax=Mycobacterium sp. SMC-4 TaxID=2857059 RepID=UPI0021B4A80B|nr:circadian clock protein KaiC [Mycobacterium sp. SMC-4]UXA16060.1 circadian clock protein KaiC [Mycobacterium sp. SMC-4]